jgi:hypothetical protein
MTNKTDKYILNCLQEKLPIFTQYANNNNSINSESASLKTLEFILSEPPKSSHN